MDPNLLKHIEYFLDPNSQAGDLDSQQQQQQQQRRFNSAASNTSTANFWDAAGLNVDSGLGSPSSAPTSLSFESYGQSAPTTTKAQSPTRSQHPFSQGSRVILPPRPPKSKAGHERKRTKLSTETTPFDNVDYWIQFDNDEGAAGEAISPELNHQKAKETHQQTSQQTQQSNQQQQPQQHQHQQQQQQQQQRPKLQHSHTSPALSNAREHLRNSREHGSSRSAAAAPTSSRPIHRSFRPEDILEDEALDYALSEEGDITAEDFGSMNLADHLSRIDSMPPPEVPPREGLYSTPLSWEKPQPGLRLDSLMSMQNPQQLKEDEQRRLIAIAMNTGPIMGGLGSGQFGQAGGSRGYVAGGGLHATLGSGINLAALGGFGGFGGLGNLGMGQITDDAPLLRPETPPVAKEPQPRLSRSSTEKPETKGKGKGKEKETHKEEEDDDHDSKETKGKGKSGDRTAHNDIERKYRTNLKDKIAELRDAVPALRTIQEGVVDEGDENVPGNRPKVSKGTVLTKATEYISYLEKKNEAILAQHQQLSRRLAAFEQLLSQTARPTFQMPNYSRTLFDPRAFC